MFNMKMIKLFIFNKKNHKAKTNVLEGNKIHGYFTS